MTDLLPGYDARELSPVVPASKDPYWVYLDTLDTADSRAFGTPSVWTELQRAVEADGVGSEIHEGVRE